jgi:predicted RNA-binding Zn-ribbon protein involved in translation (DUF1610 family)
LVPREMIVAITYRCPGCGDERTLRSLDGDEPWVWFDATARAGGRSHQDGWRRLSLDGDSSTVTVCPKCVAKVIAALPVLEQTIQRARAAPPPDIDDRKY